MHTCIMTGTYFSRRLFGGPVLFCDVLFWVLKYIEFLTKQTKTFAYKLVETRFTPLLSLPLYVSSSFHGPRLNCACVRLLLLEKI